MKRRPDQEIESIARFFCGQNGGGCKETTDEIAYLLIRRDRSMLSRYDPFREALSLRRAMDQLFEQSVVQPGFMGGSQSMMVPMDICETTNGYEVDVALPGVRPEDIEVTVDQNTLTIRGHYGHQNEHQNQPQTEPVQQQSKPQAGQQTPQGQPYAGQQ